MLLFNTSYLSRFIELLPPQRKKDTPVKINVSIDDREIYFITCVHGVIIVAFVGECSKEDECLFSFNFKNDMTAETLSTMSVHISKGTLTVVTVKIGDENLLIMPVSENDKEFVKQYKVQKNPIAAMTYAGKLRDALDDMPIKRHGYVSIFSEEDGLLVSHVNECKDTVIGSKATAQVFLPVTCFLSELQVKMLKRSLSVDENIVRVSSSEFGIHFEQNNLDVIVFRYEPVIPPGLYIHSTPSQIALKLLNLSICTGEITTKTTVHEFKHLLKLVTFSELADVVEKPSITRMRKKTKKPTMRKQQHPTKDGTVIHVQAGDITYVTIKKI